MTWINPPSTDDPPKRLVVPPPRDVDAIGAALAKAFEHSAVLPTDLREPLRALDHLS